jgi:hypothetical protein
MLHIVVRALRGRRLLFTTWSEGRELWDRVVRAAPGLTALCLMPDHFHLLHAADVRDALAHAMSGYARWLNAQRRTSGPLIEPIPPPGPLRDGGKVRRNVRYVHLNPCRGHLVADPLAWPLSTHRDMVGLAAFPVVPVRRDATDFHTYVSSDPAVRVTGTELPLVSVPVPSASQVLHATSALARTPMPALLQRGQARSLYLRAARTLSPDSHRVIGDAVGVAREAVQVQPAKEDARVRAVARAVGDSRFPPLWDLDLRLQPSWARYRELE